jgi:hypothetical protein
MNCHTGAVLSFGTTWETAHPVAFDSIQLSAAQHNYPVHEKELLAVVCALEKWSNDLLGYPISVYTDHCTFEYFNSQQNLSHCQARWQEFMSQFELRIVYIHGEDNTVADLLSRLLDDDSPVTDANDEFTPNYQAWLADSKALPTVAMSLISADTQLLQDITKGYANDTFCQRVLAKVLVSLALEILTA